MKIVAVNAGADVSGAEKVLAQLIAVAVAGGDEVVLACPEGNLPDIVDPAVHHVPVPLSRLGRSRGRLGRLAAIAGLPVSWWRTARILRIAARDADAVILNSTFGLPAVGLAFPGHTWLRGSGRRRPTVTWLVHDTIHSPKQKVVALLGTHAITRAVGVSEVTAASVRRLVRRAESRPNGVRIPATPTGATTTDPARPVVGILAVLAAWKGHDVLLEAVARVPEVHLEIAGTAFPGSEDWERQLRGRAAQPDLAGRVRFLGHADPAEVFPRWDLIVSASTSPEAGPLGVLEAMAAGVPVLGTGHGGTAEYLAGGSGRLVPPGDVDALAEAMRELIHDPDGRARLRDRARQVAERDHDLTTTLPRMLEALTRA
ncbi:glycosyltransferase family 4 protein [Corynebacterium suedekumii]|uniref:Glycosyltransferase family 4 protein n=1 Tax=Corynebacterium suedekumii TaxID=3049801 RepID=A0ABY8VPC1_9CORY|nr:glycosyltransferase family 4 protein [Corynebacterium suedekumii]WIM70832.1 glycosyltransferase family 4 protein [Corynebacterium suedekumii]